MHRFTDKKGQQIDATLLGVTADMQKMRIRREDGQEFESIITLLSLDDQQYIKDWMKTRTAKTDFRLEVDITRKAQDTERHERDGGFYSFEQRTQKYAIQVRNLSRETLPPAVVEYVWVWSDLVSVYQDNEGIWDYRSYDDENGAERTKRISGRGELPALAFNRDGEVSTATFEINRISFGGDLYQEDEPVGMIARVLTKEGALLEEVRSGGAAIENLSWEQAMELPDANAPD